MAFEIIGVTASVLQFLSTAKTCLEIFQDFKQNTPQSTRVLAFRLEAESVKFQQWCELLGVQEVLGTSGDDSNKWATSHEALALQRRLEKMLKFDNEKISKLILQELQDLVRAFRKARDKISPIVSSQETDPKKLAKPAGKGKSIRGVFRFGSKPHDGGGSLAVPQATAVAEASTSSIDLISKRASVLFQGVKWVALDKRSFMDLLQDISAINDCLGTFLSVDAKIRIDRRFQGDILRIPQLQAKSANELLPEDPELQTMAAIKEAVQHEEVMNGTEVDSTEEAQDTAGLGLSSASSPILQVDDFARGTLEFGLTRCISSISNRPVLVEWTYYGKAINMGHFYRRGNLVRLLNGHDVFRKFKTLRSRGIVVDSANSRIGLAFDIPRDETRPAARSISEVTLYQVLQSQPRPLGHRFQMAVALATALYNLQSVNWLHKSIRSDNLLYLQYGQEEMDREDANGATRSAETRAQVAIEERRLGNSSMTPLSSVRDLGTSGSLSPRPPLANMYLLGWSFSRPDRPSELSQSVSISTQGYKLAKEILRLSNHPDLLQASSSGGPRPRYKAEYDIYSFGLVLLEIGHWKSLSSLYKECSHDDVKFQERVRGVYCDDLLYKMGEIYWRATARCLRNQFDLGQSGVGDVKVPLSVAFERQVLSELERCIA